MRNPDMKNVAVLMLILSLAGCAGQSQQSQAADPLKNTRQLVKKGHSDLYNNGAFHVPNTEMALIPAGPSAMELGMELAGLRARQSFTQSLQNARDSVYIVAEGSKASYELAADIHHGTDVAATYINSHSRSGGTYLVYKAYPHTKHIIGRSWEFAGDTALKMGEFGDNLAANSVTAGVAVSDSSAVFSGKLASNSVALAKSISGKTTSAAAASLDFAGSEFVQGYAALPDNLSGRVDRVSESLTLAGFASAFEKSQAYRQRRSQFYSDILVDGTRNYSAGVKASFANAGAAFDEVDQTGVSLAMLKASRWVLQAILWDGLIKPVSETALGSVGYLTVNTVTFPVMLVARSAVPVAEIAVAVSWNTAGAFYDVLAPSAIAATASLFSVAEMAAGQTAAGAAMVAGTAASGVTYVAGKGSAAVVTVAGYTAGKTVRYVGVPLSAAGIAISGTAAGVVAGGASVVSGGALLVAGETTALATQAAGNAVAGTTLVVGTTASAVGGVGLGVYELAKAVVVPTSYTLGGGIVLGYGSTSQLAAHTILAVADASYLVLSLEGPTWVVYAVQGKLGQGEQLLPGTMLDLEKMQSAGETFYALPLADEEVKKVVESLPADLPRLAPAE